MSAEPALPRSAPTEPALMARLAAGDLEALGELYDRHAEDVRRFVFRATGTLAAAEDITHDAFLTLARVADRYDGEHPPRSFLMGIAAQLVRRRRRSLAQRFKQLTAYRTQVAHQSERTPEGDAASREQLARFEAALARLPEAKRLTLLLADVEGLTGEQIAQALEVPVGTVWTRLHYARAELRRALGRSAPARGGQP